MIKYCTEKSMPDAVPLVWMSQREPSTAVAAWAQQEPHQSGRNWLRTRVANDMGRSPSPATDRQSHSSGNAASGR